MNWWLFFTPFAAAALGWIVVSLALKLLFHPLYPRKIAGIRFQGFVPKRQKEFAAKLGKLGAEMLSINEIEQKITHPDNVKKIMPQAEAHIDHFLRVKLVKSMPVVGMFVGDKTINNLKSLFVTELEELFPEIMKNYMGHLQEDLNIEQLIRTKIASIPPSSIENEFLLNAKNELRMVKILGALLGLLIGLMQLLIFLLLRP